MLDYLDKEADTELTMDMVFTDKTRLEGMLLMFNSGIRIPHGYLTSTDGVCSETTGLHLNVGNSGLGCHS
jgi:hypothetical protein